MMSRLGQKYEIEVEVTSQTREGYNSNDYAKSNLPIAPAIRIDGETIVERADISEEKLEEAIRTKLGLETIEA